MSLFSSLSNRIFLTTAALSVLSIGVAVYRVNIAVTTEAEQELQRGLNEASTIVENYRSTLLQHFTREARLVADLPKLRAAVETDHAPTVAPIAQDYQQDLNADLFMVTGRRGEPLWPQVLPDRGDRTVARQAVTEALGGHESVSLWPTPEGLLEVVSVPIWDPTQPVVLGALTIGFALDTRAAARLKALTASDIAFANRGAVQASTLPREHWRAVAPLATAREMATRWLGREEYVAVSRPLLSGRRGSGPSAATIVLRSRTERLRVLSRVHAALAATALVAVLAAIVLSYALARTVTRPLGVITSAMREVARSGDLTRRIPEPPATRWDDEDAKLLARTYNAMTESIGRFQREAAQRERLSSLGRLSTVIAHEIRNPLMIIKAALRPLRRESETSEQLRRIGTDIEEEITRLNRIVTEVLDFARPIRFEIAPADLNDVCRSAAQAVWAGDPGWTAALDLDPGVGVALTDAERLRQALINILGNARQAAESGGSLPRVSVRTRRRDAHVRIAVVDNGVGIPADLLPRVFEPFFTTKRTGSGIGLAISRNIIEGLGGTITVAGGETAGTRFEIELPLALQADTRSGSA